ncbi:hypothetical protein CORC01_11142 [Colletotrichum orchidophilum]|uniref:Uncharacterized protein n=1 Tax=Colletotrichum orchidophilum TaxID=1209926 RepID=A0A1G4AWQ0_9PEZI|nr:uncharacterized protein CORC01_11142 [Colletotrichum orchidophilum]OHE93545.1 hypothetical protein CORC01_11142 [Colletotrichum orchidophilum]
MSGAGAEPEAAPFLAIVNRLLALGSYSILGIDWGSTAIRASLCVKRTKELHSIWNTGATPGHDIRYQTGAFNATLYFDDRGGLAYTGEKFNGTCTPIPSKWFLCEDRETGNPLLDGLLAKYKGLKKRIRRNLEAIVRTVFQEVDKVCSEKPYVIEEVGLSYPAHWTPRELSSYENLIAAVMMEFKVMKSAHGHIKFHVESLASAHFLFSSRRHIKPILTKVDEPYLLVFLDFGGHTMNGCMFSVVRRSGDNLGYFRVGEAFTAHGGTQLWEKKIDEFATNYVEKSLKLTLLPSQRAEILEEFHLKIKRLQSDIFQSMILHTDDPKDNRSIAIHLRGSDAKQCFLDGLEEALNLAREKIAEAVALTSNVKIVLSGGSGKNSLVQADVQHACAELGIDKPFLLYEAVSEKDSFNISKGAAYATADKITVQEFIQRGAAFGFQLGRPEKGKDGPFISWESAATLALDADGPHYFRKRYGGGTRLRIVCDPFLQSSAKWDHIPSVWCYDVLEIAPPPKGHWEFSLRLHDFGHGELGLVIRKTKLTWTSKAMVETRNYGPFPLFYDASSNCCLINTDKIKSEDIDFYNGILLTDGGELVPCDPEAVADQILDLQKEKDDMLRESSRMNASISDRGKEENEQSNASGKRPLPSDLHTRGTEVREGVGRNNDKAQEPAFKRRLMLRQEDPERH